LKALLILNGDYSGTELLKALSLESDLTICADGGARHAEAAVIAADVILGDMDSYSGSTPAGIPVRRYPKEKDYTDGELALDTAIKEGADHIAIACAGGGRPDHFYGNLLLLDRAAKAGVVCSVFAGGYEITLASGRYSSKTAPGKLFSVLPYDGDFTYQKNTGLSYRIDRPVHVKAHEAFGISNQAAAYDIEIHISGGRALIFREL